MSRAIGVVVALVLALAGTVVLTTYVRSADARAREGLTLVDVLVVIAEVPEGTSVADLGPFVQPQPLPQEALAQGALETLEGLETLQTGVDLKPGEQLLRSRLVDPAVAASTSTVEIPDGMQEITVALAPSRAVGGLIRPGDTVGIFSSFSDVEGEQTGVDAEGNVVTEEIESTPTTQLILHHVLVTNVQAEQLVTADETTEDGTGVSRAPTGNLLVTLAVAAPDAERVVFTAEHGTIWLSDEPLTAEAGSGGVVTARTIYP